MSDPNNPSNQYEYIETSLPEHVRRERLKARELRGSSWWKQQLGKGICYFCEQRFSRAELTMDHLIPLSRGGRSTKKNIVVACKQCNSHKKKPDCRRDSAAPACLGRFLKRSKKVGPVHAHESCATSVSDS